MAHRKDAGADGRDVQPRKQQRCPQQGCAVQGVGLDTRCTLHVQGLKCAALRTTKLART